MYIKKINDALKKVGIEISIDQIRKLEKFGIVLCHRNKNNGYREFTEEEFNKTLRNIFMYYALVPIEDIKKNNPEVIKEHITKIKRGLRWVCQHSTT